VPVRHADVGTRLFCIPDTPRHRPARRARGRRPPRRGNETRETKNESASRRRAQPCPFASSLLRSSCVRALRQLHGTPAQRCAQRHAGAQARRFVSCLLTAVSVVAPPLPRRRTEHLRSRECRSGYRACCAFVGAPAPQLTACSHSGRSSRCNRLEARWPRPGPAQHGQAHTLSRAPAGTHLLVRAPHHASRPRP
jgi:hypothetical protein